MGAQTTPLGLIGRGPLYTYLVVTIHLRVGPGGGCKGQLTGVLYDDATGDVEVEGAGRGGMNS